MSKVVTPEQPGIMKPDIVFFGEGLGDEFHKSVAIDKNEVRIFIFIFICWSIIDYYYIDYKMF